MFRTTAGQPSPNPTAHLAGVGKGSVLPRSAARRAVGSAAVVSLGAVLAFTGTSTVHPVQAQAAPPLVAASSSDALADSWGIKVITSGAPGNNPWNDKSRVMSELRGLGVRHIRTPLFHNNKGQLAYLNTLGQQGITALLTMGRPDGQGGTVPQLVADAASVSNAVYEVEGSNEWDLRGGANWVSTIRGHQAALYAAMKANPAMRNKPVLGPSMGHEEDMAKLGDISGSLDIGNLHNYPGGQKPSVKIDRRMQLSKANRGNKPVAVSETGYHNYLQDTSTHLPASEAVAGAYYPRLVLENYKRGVRNVFSYQLLDNRPGQTGVVDNRESHFGLVRNDWSHKPAYDAMANFMSLVSDPGAGGFKAAPLSYAVTNAPSDLRQVLVGKRDGSHILFLWRDVSIWDPKARKNTPVASRTVNLNLGQRANLQMMRPSASALPFSASAGTSLQVPLGGEVVAITIR